MATSAGLPTAMVGRQIPISIVLPADTLSVTVSMADTKSVAELKEYLYRACDGHPHPSGQSLVYLGRTLENDEVLGQCCNADGIDAYIFYLTVQYSSWTDKPPPSVAPPFRQAQPQQPVSYPVYQPTAFGNYAYIAPYPAAKTDRYPLEYIHWLHHNCLRALLGLPSYTIPAPRGRNIESHKENAKKYMEWSWTKWPPVFEREQELYDSSRRPGEGLEYAERVFNGKPTLMLLTTSKEPTSLQKLAIDMMTFTLPLLSIEVSEAELEEMNPVRRKRRAVADAYAAAVSWAVAHDLPLPAIPEALMDEPSRRRARAFPQRLTRAFRAINARRMMGPLLMLAFRAAIVFWFLKPFRKPYIPLLLVAWIVWEIWSIVFENIVRQAAAQAQIQAAAQRLRAQAIAAHNANAGIGGNAAGAQAGGAAANANGRNANANGGQPNGNAPGLAQGALDPPMRFWRRSARVFFAHEAKAIFGTNHVHREHQPGAPAAAQPALDGRDNQPAPRSFQPLTLVHRIWSFVVLFILTIHPGFWEQRREALRRRETEIRVTYGRLRGDDDPEQREQREGEEPPPEYPQPPPGWVGQYVNRARMGLA